MNGYWADSFPAEIIVCDPDGIILEMNAHAIKQYQNQGGAALVGQNVFNHHPPEVRAQIKSIVTRRQLVVYTTEKQGLRTMVSISPWFQDNKYAGFTLLTLPLPEKMDVIHKG
ncbi:MAG: hypothetical protein LWX83_01425 [Anaerolineae bacterium]|nr:hypothetical protein [Anaerolineae bacterium]